MSHRRIQREWIAKLQDATSVLIGKRLARVVYFDAIDDSGRPFFESGNCAERHELMWGLDLVTEDETTVGFAWDWCPELLSYGIAAHPGGLSKNALKAGATGFDETAASVWQSRVGRVMASFGFSKGAESCADDIVCDCCVRFGVGPSVWICARQSNRGCDANGDDCVVILTEAEAERLGINTAARD